MKALFAGILLMLLVLAYDQASSQTLQPAFAINVAAASTTITSAAYVQLDAATDASCTALAVFNSTAQVIYLATGAASSENRIKYDIPPSTSAVHIIKLGIAKGLRLSARAVAADATTGFLVVNCLQ